MFIFIVPGASGGGTQLPARVQVVLDAKELASPNPRYPAELNAVPESALWRALQVLFQVSRCAKERASSPVCTIWAHPFLAGSLFMNGSCFYKCAPA